MTTASSQTPDPRMALLQEIGAKVPDPVHEIHAYGWAKLELLGHRVLYGYLDQVEFCGSRVLRIRQPVKQPGGAADAEIQLVEVGRYGVAAMYGCAPLTKIQALANLDWVRDQLAELWHSTRSLPERGSSTGDPDDLQDDQADLDLPDEECPHCLAPAGQPCRPGCSDDDASRPLNLKSNIPDAVSPATSSDGDLS